MASANFQQYDDGHPQRQRGVVYGVLAYGLWGFSVVYWKWLQSISALEVVSHRVLWAGVILGIIVLWRKRLPQIWSLFRTPRSLKILCITGVLLAINWTLFVWAVVNDQVLQASLGYYINPLVSVALGNLLLNESMNRFQTAAIALAAVGVLGMLVIAGEFPWIALTLAITFGIYGYLRKVGGFIATDALFVEMALFFPIVLTIIVGIEGAQGGVIANQDWLALLLLFGGGFVTFVPLMFFGEAVMRVRLSTMGLLQYIAPTTHFFLAVLIYGEIFTTGHAFAFACIWTALALYSGETLWRERRMQPTTPRR